MTLAIKRFSRILLIAATGATLLGAGLPAQAQSTKQRITTLEEKTQRLERLLKNQQDLQTDLLSRVQGLQDDNQELRNLVETLQFEGNRNGERQRELYIDLDQRMQVLEAAPTSANSGSASSGGAISLVGGSASMTGSSKVSDADAYQAAFNELRDGRYPQAASGFSNFLADYPDSDLRGNAQYWLAESHYVQKDYPTALASFQKVVSDYPASRKIADSWLKIGYCNFELEKWTEARQALSTAVNQFPDSTASKLAKERLVLMDKQGV